MPIAIQRNIYIYILEKEKKTTIRTKLKQHQKHHRHYIHIRLLIYAYVYALVCLLIGNNETCKNYYLLMFGNGEEIERENDGKI